MTEDERMKICEAIAVSCMWGHGGLGSCIVERLDKTLPEETSWKKMYDAHAKEFQRRSIPTVADEAELRYWLDLGYSLHNWDDQGCSLFRSRKSGGGLFKYVGRDLAETYRWMRA